MMISLWRRISTKPDHPMRDLKAAQQLLSDLPRQDTFKALQEVTAWTESVTQASGYRLPIRANILLMLDRAGYGMQRKLQQEYLAQTRASKYRETAIWRVLCDYWKSIVSAYLLCLDAHAMGARGADQLKSQLPLLAARGLHATVMLHKCMLLHYGPVEDFVWQSLSRLWLFVEAQELEHVVVDLYEHSVKPTTCQTEMLKVLFLASSSPDSLQPQQIDLAERMIDDVADALVMSREPDSRSAYFYDLTANQAPGRLVVGMPVSPRMRFIGPSMASIRLQELARALENPSAVSASSSSYVAPAGSLRFVLQHLLYYWSMQPAERKWPRVPAYGRLTVLHGFEDVLRTILTFGSSPLATINGREVLERQKRDIDFYGFVTDETRELLAEAERKPDTLEQQAESWLVQNVSLGGYGAVLPPVRGEWLQVGVMLGVRTDREGEWQVGVVRRLQFDVDGQAHVGIEIMAARLAPVKIRRDRPDLHGGVDFEEYALLFGSNLDFSTTATLLMRSGVYQTGKQYQVGDSGDVYLLAPIRLLERGDGFDIVELNVLCKLPVQ